MALFCSMALLSLETPGVAHGRGRDDTGGADATIRVGVLSLFHTREILVTATSSQALIVSAEEHELVLESSGVPSATIKLQGAELAISSGSKAFRASRIKVAGRGNDVVDFTLAVPGRITRPYHGALEIMPVAGELEAIVTLNLEMAVASVVAAEGSPETPLEALKAYAIAARSYFVAGRGRHRDFDFCDTTHCQFLRTLPSPTSNFARAVESTRDLILEYHSAPFAAMYTRSCSGRTHTPAQLGLTNSVYPYYSVACEHCRLHPARWTSRLSAKDAAFLQAGNESVRLAIDRRLGWSAVPSNDFSVNIDGERAVLTGIGNGHGIGLCQAGARAMAESGADYRQILQHYYPNTEIVERSVSRHH